MATMKSVLSGAKNEIEVVETTGCRSRRWTGRSSSR